MSIYQHQVPSVPSSRLPVPRRREGTINSMRTSTLTRQSALSWKPTVENVEIWAPMLKQPSRVLTKHGSLQGMRNYEYQEIEERQVRWLRDEDQDRMQSSPERITPQTICDGGKLCERSDRDPLNASLANVVRFFLSICHVGWNIWIDDDFSLRFHWGHARITISNGKKKRLRGP